MSQTKRDYYEILGIERGASQEQIKRAFRSCASRLHPDNMDSGDEKAFKELAAAYEVLSDEHKRSLYDRFGHDGVSSNFDSMDFGGFGDLSDIFSTFFGGGYRPSTRGNAVERGSDLRYDLELKFEEAVFGITKKITIPHLENCTVCSGSGAAVGSSRVQCGACNGQGQVRQSTATFLGNFTQVTVCPHCEGQGSRLEKPCQSCDGTGQAEKEHEIELKVPAGVDNNSKIRISGEGDQGKRGEPPGDLYVVLKVIPHTHFYRDGHTIHLNHSIGFAKAALGGEVVVPTLDGDKALKVLPGVQSGNTMIMRGTGVPHLNNPNRRGDQVVHIIVETPTNLSAEEKELFERIAQLASEKQDNVNQTRHSQKQNKFTNKEDSSIFNKLTDVFKPKDSE